MRLAIVYPSGHFFDTPCIPNLAVHLTNYQIEVDVYLIKNTATPIGKILNDRVRLHYFPYKTLNRSKENIFLLIAIFLPWVTLKLLRNNPNFLIAAGIRSLFITGLITYFTQMKFAYNSLEIYSMKHSKTIAWHFFKFFESFFERRASFSIIQDKRRADLLRKENRLPKNHIVLFFPNAPFIQNFYYYQYSKHFSISQKKIILFSGSLNAKWSALPAIIRIVDKLNDNTVLYLQSRNYLPDFNSRINLDKALSRKNTIIS